MSDENRPNKFYFISVTVLTFILPAACATIESVVNDISLSFPLLGKWFIFSAVGLRLFIAGIRQIAKPELTVKQIFGIDSQESFPIMREVGFSNLCFGLVGILSLFFPAWRIVSAFSSGLYYGLAGALHFLKKDSNVNERFAMITDLVIFVLLLIYFVSYF